MNWPLKKWHKSYVSKHKFHVFHNLTCSPRFHPQTPKTLIYKTSEFLWPRPTSEPGLNVPELSMGELLTAAKMAQVVHKRRQKKQNKCSHKSSALFISHYVNERYQNVLLHPNKSLYSLSNKTTTKLQTKNLYIGQREKLGRNNLIASPFICMNLLFPYYFGFMCFDNPFLQDFQEFFGLGKSRYDYILTSLNARESRGKGPICKGIWAKKSPLDQTLSSNGELRQKMYRRLA